MNKRIRKKKEQQRLAWTIRELVTETLRHGNVDNRLLRYGKRHSQHMEKQEQLSHACKQRFPQLHKTASYPHSHNAYYDGNKPFPACHLENKTLKEVVHLSKP